MRRRIKRRHGLQLVSHKKTGYALVPAYLSPDCPSRPPAVFLPAGKRRALCREVHHPEIYETLSKLQLQARPCDRISDLGRDTPAEASGYFSSSRTLPLCRSAHRCSGASASVLGSSALGVRTEHHRVAVCDCGHALGITSRGHAGPVQLKGADIDSDHIRRIHWQAFDSQLNITRSSWPPTQAGRFAFRHQRTSLVISSSIFTEIKMENIFEIG